MSTAIFTAAFDAVSAALGDAIQSTITRGSDSVSCLCTGFDQMRMQDDYGRVIGVTGRARYKQSAEPTKPIEQGETVTVTTQGANYEGRVIGRRNTGGIVILTIQAEFE